TPFSGKEPPAEEEEKNSIARELGFDPKLFSVFNQYLPIQFQDTGYKVKMSFGQHMSPLVNKQFNSPIKLYSPENVQEALNKHTQALSNGAIG
ncbi:hypothetical protein C0J52_07079, partial [Blattella germanica]